MKKIIDLNSLSISFFVTVWFFLPLCAMGQQSDLSKEGITFYEAGLELSVHHTNYLISGTDDILIRSERFSSESYSTTDSMRQGISIDLGVSFQLHRHLYVRPKVAWLSHKSFFESNSNFHYSDVNKVSYQIFYNYNYIGAGGEAGFLLPFEKVGHGFLNHCFYLSAGIGFMAYKFRDNSELKYLSNDPGTGPDVVIEQRLDSTITGKNFTNPYLTTTVGYKFAFLRFTYNIPSKDVLETGPNSYEFIENDNTRNKSWMIGVGFQFPIVSRLDYRTDVPKILTPARFVDPLKRKPNI